MHKVVRKAIRQQGQFVEVGLQGVGAAAVEEQLTIDVNVFLVQFLREDKVVPVGPIAVIADRVVSGQQVDVLGDALRTRSSAARSVEIDNVIAPRSVRLKNARTARVRSPKCGTSSDVILLDPQRHAQGIVRGGCLDVTDVRDVNPCSAFACTINGVVSGRAAMTAAVRSKASRFAADVTRNAMEDVFGNPGEGWSNEGGAVGNAGGGVISIDHAQCHCRTRR